MISQRLIPAVGVGLGVLLAATDPATAGEYSRTIAGKTYTFLDYSWNHPSSNTTWSQPGRLYVPTTYDGTQALPVVMFLHGLGESGTNNISQLNSNIDTLIQRAESEGFLLYAPQNDGWWQTPDRPIAVLGEIARDYNVDVTRMYVTGLSSGGRGTQYALRSRPELFAAFAPLAMASETFTSAADAQVAVDRPVWYFVGEADSHRSNSRHSVNYILSAQGQPTINWDSYSEGGPYTDGSKYFAYNNVQFSEYAGMGHNGAAWRRTYDEDAFYDWLFAQRSEVKPLRDGDEVLIDIAAEDNDRQRTDSEGRAWSIAGSYRIQRVEEFVLGFVRDREGAATTISMEITRPFDGQGTAVSSEATAFDDPIAASTYWTADSNGAEITLHGLTPGQLYDLDLFASHTGGGYLARYEVDGQSQQFDASNNVSDLIHFGDLMPTADGDLVLSMQPMAGERYAVLNAISLRAVPEPATLALAAVGIGALVVGRRRV